ncbi:60S ribosomal protein L39 [Dimargaris verticillata]|uniref:Large ribosomal subunit protein eL39 n=1 Tax=Dimargaris verticillata TaxID=2761393 RepID=A0A9W8B339_9FUNG|nr:60S ribosomal protein L39 [Dimargaris verticillata]
MSSSIPTGATPDVVKLEQAKQEQEVLKNELASLKAGRDVYQQQGPGRVFIRSSKADVVAKNQSRIEELRKHVDESKTTAAHKSLIIKKKLGKKLRQNRPLPQWFRFKSDTTIRYNAKRRNWRRTKLNF